MIRHVLLAGAAVVAFAATQPAVGSVTIEVDDGPYLVGDPIPVQLSFPVPAGQRPTLPVWSETWGEAEIREVGPLETGRASGAPSVATQQIVITFFRSGTFELPLPSVPGAEQAGESTASEAAPITITVDSLLPAGDEMPQARPPAAPAPLPWGGAFFAVTATFALLALAAIVALAIRVRAAAGGLSVARDDPLTTLTRALGSLRSDADLDEIFTAVSLHLRQFFGRALSFPAAESTTSEIRRYLRRQQLPAEIASRTEQLLLRCDSVKFARSGASTSDVPASIEEAGAIGAQTTAFLARQAAEEEALSE